MQMSWKVILHPLVKRLNWGCNLAEAFALKSKELACEHGVIIKDESDYLIVGEVSSHKLEAGQFMFENDGILDKIAWS